MWRQTSSSDFQEIDMWEEKPLDKFLPGLKLVYAENSNIIFVVERGQYGFKISLLDRLATLISTVEKINSSLKMKEFMTKDEATHIASTLMEQSKKLESLAMTYKLMATALSASKDNFVEIARQDKSLRDKMDNPF